MKKRIINSLSVKDLATILTCLKFNLNVIGCLLLEMDIKKHKECFLDTISSYSLDLNKVLDKFGHLDIINSNNIKNKCYIEIDKMTKDKEEQFKHFNSTLDEIKETYSKLIKIGERK